jgi:hypothetical protein
VTATYAIFPYETDQCTFAGCVNNTGTGYGIFTSVSGTAPNRIFNIEYRTAYYNSGATAPTLNYEVRLFEGQTAFDVIYGTVPPTFTPPAARTLTVGVQKTNTTQFTQVGCDTTGGSAPPVSSGQIYHYTLGGCGPTPTPGTPTPTPGGGTPTPTPSCAPGWAAGPNVLTAALVRAPGNYFPANGRFYSIGGRTSDAAGSDTTNPFEYNPGTNTWTMKPSLLPDGKVNNMVCGVHTVSDTAQI